MIMTQEFGVLKLVNISLAMFWRNIKAIFVIFLPLILLTLVGSIPFIGLFFNLFHFFLAAFSNIAVMKYIYEKELKQNQYSVTSLMSFIINRLAKFSKLVVFNWFIGVVLSLITFVLVIIFISAATFVLSKTSTISILVFLLAIVFTFVTLRFIGRIFINIAFVFQAAAIEEHDTAWQYFNSSKKIARSDPGKTDTYFFVGILLLLPFIVITGILLFPFVKAFALLLFLGIGFSVFTVINITFGAVLLIFILNLYVQIQQFPKKAEVLELEYKNIF